MKGSGRWFLLSLLLGVLSLGFGGVLKLLFGFALLLGGALVAAYAISDKEKKDEDNDGDDNEAENEGQEQEEERCVS